MKNQHLFLAFFALFLISKAQNAPQDTNKVNVIVLNNEDPPDVNAVVDAAIARVGEEAVVGTFGEVTTPIEKTAILPIGETPVPSVKEVVIIVLEQAVIEPEEAGFVKVINNVINTTNESGPSLTVQALPAPTAMFVSSAQAKVNYGQAASRLSGVNGPVLVTDPYGNVNIFNASDLARALSYVAGNLSDSGPDIWAPYGGNIQFVLLQAESLTSSLWDFLPSPY